MKSGTIYRERMFHRWVSHAIFLLRPTWVTPAILLHAGPALSQSDGESVRFQMDVLPILQVRCVSCHGGKTRSKELDLRSLEGVRKGSESGPVVVPGNPHESTLYQQINRNRMPLDLPEGLPEAERSIIRTWIEKAALSEFPPDSVMNQHDILPIMFRHCVACHGLHKQEGGLDLRSRATMLQGGESGPALVPGNPGKSLLFQRIHSGEMPPKKRFYEVGVQPVATADLARLKRWILQGAPQEDIQPDAADTKPDPLVSDEDRQFWAFQPPRPISAPTIQRPDQVENPIDAFILEQLEKHGLSLSPVAERLILIRRAYFDLTGMPPDPEEARSFLVDPDPKAYDKLVNRLLSSPRYGERWGRHWLDVAGYSDHEGGKVNVNGPARSHAWRYRDYVIRSFNQDKPYDRFLLEQLAGDELEDYENAPVLTEGMIDNLIATGFMRLGPDSTGFELSFVEDRFDVIADQIEIFGSAVLGLTIQCARCHSHKFDPIPQRDYYRLLAVFKGALDEYDWLVSTSVQTTAAFKQRVLPYARPRTNALQLLQEQNIRKARNARLEEQIQDLKAELENRAALTKISLLEEHRSQLSAELYRQLKETLETPARQRGEEQQELARKFEQYVGIAPEDVRQRDPEYGRLARQTARQIAWLQYEQESQPHIRALWDRGEPSPTYILRRGQQGDPGRLVGPGVLSVLTDGKTPFAVKPPWPGTQKTGRRLALARWLVQPEHPLTARVLVNRIWRHHFGRGIVETLSNFGRSGARPTHPQLLDWLALELIRQGWSIKSMHQLIMTSRTYRQSSQVTYEPGNLDPQNRLWSRWPLKRLDAEALRDTLLLASGKLDERRYGSPDPVFVRADGLANAYDRNKRWRRSIYLRQLRFNFPTTLDLFDYPQMNPNCSNRAESIVAPQALHLLNDSHIRELAGSLAERVRQTAGNDLHHQIDQAYWIALSRPPKRREKEASLALMQQANRALGSRAEARAQTLTKFCHTILNSAAFVYID